MNLNDVIAALSDAPDTSPLVFTTAEGEVGAGYHVTELKLAQITGIDCAARVSKWTEASLQLLDGAPLDSEEGRAHMPLGKFLGILRQSEWKVPGLGDAPLKVEFAHGNEGLRTFELGKPEITDDRVVIRLQGSHAVCKPAFAWAGVRGLAKVRDKVSGTWECCS